MKYYEIIQYKETRRYLVAGVLVEGGDSVDRAHTGFKELLRELWQSYDVQPLCDFRIFHILLILFHSKGERNGLEPVLTQRQSPLVSTKRNLFSLHMQPRHGSSNQSDSLGSD